MIDEDAGTPNDARNFISIPKEKFTYFDYFNFIILV